MAPDLLLVGGGLANGLIAFRLRQLRPELRVMLLEAGPEPGGNHLWCFHDSDLEPVQQHWLSPFIEHSWPAQEVRFPGLSRRLATAYHGVSSARFARTLRGALPPGAIVTGRRAVEVAADRVLLEDGEEIRAGAVVDGRGHLPTGDLALGYQKFVGRELRLETPHGIALPTIMDATVPQEDGFRFVYLLPLGPDRLMVEDTYYSGSPALDRQALRARVDEYCAGRGWRVAAVEREEEGVLPIPLAGAGQRILDGLADGVAPSGTSAGLFHPVTGYSLPDAVRVADLVARLPDLAGPVVATALRAHARQAWDERAYLRFLARMMFRAAEPDARWRVLARFYRMPEGLIRRFYAGRLTVADKARLLIGRPPVPVGRAAALLFDRQPEPSAP